MSYLLKLDGLQVELTIIVKSSKIRETKKFEQHYWNITPDWKITPDTLQRNSLKYKTVNHYN